MSQESIVEMARSLVPLINQERPDGDCQAQLTSNVVTACGEAGLFRMTAPREVCGLESTMTDIVQATEVVSGVDPAVGWYIQNSVPVSRIVASLEREAREAVFAHRNVNFGNASQNQGLAVADGEGFRLSGQWPVVTGVASSEWSGMVGTVTDGGEPRLIDGNPDVRTFIVPTESLEVLDTWKGVTAMRGTGSNAVVARDIFVPDAFVYSTQQPVLIDRPYFHTSSIVFNLPPVAATVIGVLTTAIEAVTQALSQHTASVTGVARRDQPASQEFIAQCRMSFRGMRASLYEISAKVDEAIACGSEITPEMRADLYAICMLICEEGAALASRIYTCGTRDAFMRDNAVELALKDLHAIGYVMAAFRNLVHSAGRVMLGGQHDPGL